MRWDELFGDLEARARGWELAERDAEVADRTRGEIARIVLANRLRAQQGRTVAVRLGAADRVEGRIERVGSDWFLLGATYEFVVPLAAVSAVHGLALDAVSPDGVGQVEARLSLASALRALAVDRAAVVVLMRDGGRWSGTLTRVGADFVDLTVHEPDAAPRRGQTYETITVLQAAVAAVRRAAPQW